MTVIPQGPGAVLVLSPSELPGLSREELLPLVRRALARAGSPVLPAMELQVFFGRTETLCLVLPGAGPAEEKNIFGFS